MIEVPLLDPGEGDRIVPSAERYFQSGERHRKLGNIGGAEHCYISALRLDPNHPGVLSSLSCIAGDRGQFAAALAMAQRAANIAPDHPAFLANLGVALFQNQRAHEAAQMLMAAITRSMQLRAAGHTIPDGGLGTLWHNLGLARMAASQPGHAISCFKIALDLMPGEARVLRDLGIAKLATGQWGEGLIAHEARWSDLQRYPIWDSGIPRWEGEDLKGKTIIVHHEQGFGDTIQFVRFLPWLKARGARVILAVPVPLMRLMALSGLADEVVEITGVIPPADFHSPMLSVPAYLELTTERIPQEPYLRAPESLGIPIRRPAGTRLVVGLVWAGSPGYVPDLRRSMPFEAMLCLADLPGVTLVSLQKGERAGDIGRAGMTGLMADLSGLLGDFADTAAALMQIDVLISVDTAPLHLAGALGRPAIALLPHWRCWRWGVEREDSPWYPSLRLATQESPGDWGGLVTGVRDMIASAEITGIEEGAECPTTMQTLSSLTPEAAMKASGPFFRSSATSGSANSSTSSPELKRTSTGAAGKEKATKPTTAGIPTRRSGSRKSRDPVSIPTSRSRTGTTTASAS
jgi:Glycosyltransferase family 9 (heptosyltransferase)/Tetratricopeptide repeat